MLQSEPDFVEPEDSSSSADNEAESESRSTVFSIRRYLCISIICTASIPAVTGTQFVGFLMDGRIDLYRSTD